MTIDHELNIRTNLRTLIGSMRSITDASHQLGINRQQLNKYLSGATVPSVRTLLGIASHFNVTVDSLAQAPQDFISDQNNAANRQDLSFSGVAGNISQLLSGSKNTQAELLKHCGKYHLIYIMPDAPTKLVKALAKIYQLGEETYATFVEYILPNRRFSSRIRRYRQRHSLVISYGGRLYLLDATETTRLMGIILYPELHPFYATLRGRMLTVSNADSRAICSVPCLLQRIGWGSVVRSDLITCGVYRIEDPFVDSDIRDQLISGHIFE